MREQPLPHLLSPRHPERFPDPRKADAEGLVAFGGDLSVRRLLAAYRAGIFPWYDEDTVPLWWSPDPRCAFTPQSLHVSRSLEKRIRRNDYSLTWNRDFRAVMSACAEDRDDGTWILPEMLDAYCELHRVGHAHSLEVWQSDRLVGGLYGVQIGALFAAESMFHRVTDMSKIAVVAAVRSTFRAGIGWFDVQMPTEHLNSLGALTIPRAQYLDALPALVTGTCELAKIEPTIDA
ncbi:MAG: leucyl/phenylalanyl-tRNA--protein transferase [Planctomycetota bacterium]